MKVLIKDDFVDFEAPIQMTYSQRDAFIKFMEKMFPGEVTTKDVIEKEREGRIGPTKPKNWILKELSLLLEPITNEEIADKLRRTEMSVRMKRGDFPSEFLEWAKKRGYTQSQSSSEKLIKQFLDERGRR